MSSKSLSMAPVSTSVESALAESSERKLVHSFPVDGANGSLSADLVFQSSESFGQVASESKLSEVPCRVQRQSTMLENLTHDLS